MSRNEKDHGLEILDAERHCAVVKYMFGNIQNA